MSSIKESLTHKTWTRDSFLISTDPDLVPVEQLAKVWETDEIYWAKSTPPEVLREMLRNSLVFGLYALEGGDEKNANGTTSASALSTRKFIGMGRCVTDYATIMYLTDVWVDSSFAGRGLGSWIINCVRETADGMPHLRRILLLTGDWERSVPFYRKLLGAEVLELTPGKTLAVMSTIERGNSHYVEKHGGEGGA